jgi:hypothetical protein
VLTVRNYCLNLLKIVTFLALLLWISPVQAQRGLPDTTGEALNFVIPERNQDGLPIWILQGKRARLRPDGKKEIDGLIVNTYHNTEVDWTFSTSNCILNQPAHEAVGEQDVHMYNKQIDIKGKGFHWLANESRFIVRSKAQVIILGGITKKSIL